MKLGSRLIRPLLVLTSSVMALRLPLDPAPHGSGQHRFFEARRAASVDVAIGRVYKPANEPAPSAGSSVSIANNRPSPGPNVARPAGAV
jgi:hypothetical protein